VLYSFSKDPGVTAQNIAILGRIVNKNPVKYFNEMIV
jgi:hypothetical protein